MPLYFRHGRGKAWTLSAFACRMWSPSSVLVLRELSTSSCSKNSKNLLSKPLLHLQKQRHQQLLASARAPFKLIVCRHGNGRLRATSLGLQLQDGNRPRGDLMRAPWNQGSALALVAAETGQPRSLMKSGHAENPPKWATQTGVCAAHGHHGLGTADGNRHGVAEEPLLFSVGSASYRLALDTIAAANDSGNLSGSAAARLKDLCHLLHVESLIRAAARPCYDTTDDIIIRKGGNWRVRPNPARDCVEAGAHRIGRVLPTGDSASHRASSQAWRRIERVAPSANLVGGVEAVMPSATSSSKDLALGQVDHRSHGLGCGEAHKMQPDNDRSPSGGPSKDQLAYMHHRLSEEMPRFFEQYHDYGLYADNVLFDNRIMKVNTRGVTAYKATVQSLKYLITAYLLRTEMELLRITMEMDRGCVQARWRIKGVPLHSYALRPWGKQRKYRYFDAFSTFHVGADGLIQTHVLDKVMPSADKVPVSSWAVRLGIALGLVRPPAFDPDIMKAIGFMKTFLSK